MKILIACEESGKVRDAFTKAGHDTISCDLLPSRTPGRHFQGTLETIIDSCKWDRIIAFPPCTFVCVSGLHHNKRNPERAKETEKAVGFFKMVWEHSCNEIVIENPVGFANLTK